MLRRWLGTRNQRIIKHYSAMVARINEVEKSLWNITFKELLNRKDILKEILVKDPEGNFYENLIESFAIMKNACRRLVGEKWDVCNELYTWNLVPYDVQLVGGAALADGKVNEMATGEGKTLSAVFPLFFHALSGKGAHLSTANDYLAWRDHQWMGKVFQTLGLSVGCLQSQMPASERKKAYAADITYGAGKEFGFDYLRDHSLAYSADDFVQRGHHYIIVDEADSVLIDEARTPLIISGQPVQEKGSYASVISYVREMVEMQNRECKEMLDSLLTKDPDDYSVEQEGVQLFILFKGDPKDDRFRRLTQNFKVVQMIRDAEIYLMRDFRRKRIKETLNGRLHYIVDARSRNTYLTERGLRHLEEKGALSFLVPDINDEIREIESSEEAQEMKIVVKENLLEEVNVSREKIHAVNNLLKAFTLYQKDVDYCVEKGAIVLIDAFTGRLMNGRRLMDGLHQAIEVKENIPVSSETGMIATITAQSYYRLYERMAGMSGTAVTSADEFREFYDLEVVKIPTHKQAVRVDYSDIFYKTEKEKMAAVVENIQEVHMTGRPVLTGTVSVEKSEMLSGLLNEKGISHHVLNAKNHQKEAQIVGAAGRRYAVTIATNMAGRGTDIRLENPADGGLHVIGTERHESRRIDNQLRGRSGRQGDPGSSVFFISLEDDLLKKFGVGKLVKAMKFLTLDAFKKFAIPFMEGFVSFAQRNVEMRNFEIRRALYEHDRVIDDQRRIIYSLRDQVLFEDKTSVVILDFLKKIKPDHNWDDVYHESKEAIGTHFEVVERMALLGAVDKFWIQHLLNIEELKEGVHYRLMTPNSPRNEFERESFRLFDEMMKEIMGFLEKSLFA